MNVSSVADSSRVVFIDQARAFAIAMMILGHSLDRFLAEPFRSAAGYDQYQFFRGITSALFLMVSGFSFVVASFHHFDHYTRWTPRLAARLRRVALILFLGYVLNRAGSTLPSFLDAVQRVGLDPFFRFDVLQNIGFGLLLLHLIVILSRRPERFWKFVLIAMIASFSLAPLTYDITLDRHLPVLLRPALNQFHQSMFPMIPFTGYLLLGALFGQFFHRTQRTRFEGRVMASLAIVGLALVVFEGVVRNLIPGGLFPYSPSAGFMPGYTFVRCGMAMIVIAALYLLGRFKTLLPRLSFTLSRDALLIYVIHLPLIYNLRGGPVDAMVHQLTPLQAAVLACGILAAMIAVAALVSVVRRRHEARLTEIRNAVIAGFLIGFFLFDETTVWHWCAALAAGALAVRFVPLLVFAARRRE